MEIKIMFDELATAVPVLILLDVMLKFKTSLKRFDDGFCMLTTDVPHPYFIHAINDLATTTYETVFLKLDDILKRAIELESREEANDILASCSVGGHC